MIEFLKILIEEPAKLTKYILSCIKMVLNCIVASYLYIKFFGAYSIIIPTDFKALSEFFLSGRVLICIVLYFSSEVLLFIFLSTFCLLPLDSIAEKLYLTKPDKWINKLFLWGFKKIKLIKMDPTTKEYKAGENIDIFHDFLVLYNEKESKEEVYSFKNSFVNKTMKLFFIFILIYIFILKPEVKHDLVRNILITASVILPILYIEVCWFIDFLNKNSKNLLEGIKQLRFEKLIHENLHEIGIYPMRVEKPLESGYKHLIHFNNKEYILEYHLSKWPVSEYLIESYRDKFLKAEKRMILITNSGLTKNAIDVINEHKNSLLIIHFKDEIDLQHKLESNLKAI